MRVAAIAALGAFVGACDRGKAAGRSNGVQARTNGRGPTPTRVSPPHRAQGASAGPEAIVQRPPAPTRPQGPQSRIPIELRSQAIGYEEFDNRLDDNEWVFFAHGVNSCDAEDEPMFLPPGDDEFARRNAASRRDAIRSSLVGRVVLFEGSGAMTGTDAVFDTIGIGGGGGPFELYRSSFDFQRNQFIFHIIANSDLSPNAALGSSGGSNWGICLRGVCTPDIRPETFHEQVMRTIGRIGDRDIQVARTESDTEWQNFSHMTIPVRMAPDVAARYASNMPVSIAIYMRFVDLGHHQRCRRSCNVIFGERVCSGEDNGMGIFKKTELLAYEVRVDGQVVADFVASLAGRGG